MHDDECEADADGCVNVALVLMMIVILLEMLNFKMMLGIDIVMG